MQFHLIHLLWLLDTVATVSLGAALTDPSTFKLACLYSYSNETVATVSYSHNK